MPQACESMRAFPWYDSFLRNSPFYHDASTTAIRRRAAEALRKYKKKEPIGFTRTSSLKSMGKIARADGSYRLGSKYCKLWLENDGASLSE